MAKVTRHEAMDGSLHKTAAICAKHDVAQRVKKAVGEAKNLDLRLVEDTEGHMALSVNNLPEFIANNADAFRNILNSSLVARRTRKPAAKSEAAHV